MWVPARNYNPCALTGQVRVSPISLSLAVVAMALFAGCGHRHDLTKPANQDNFGVEMARMNLWREAMFRFRRAVEINPADAMAHNNLAVAYEANGDFDSARKEYLEALKLDRSNQYIQKNYSRYVEFLSRNKKRQTKDVKTASTPAMPQSGATSIIQQAPPPLPPVSVDPSKPTPPPTAPPSDRPEPPKPTPPGVSS